MDTLTKAQRSKCMSQVRVKNTSLEMLFRKEIFALGIKGYRLRSKIPGKPDLYFPKRKIAVFIDGCFWHGCPVCRSLPETNKTFWVEKIAKNRNRDAIVTNELQKMGIQVLRIWGHEVKKNSHDYTKKLYSFLSKE